MATPIDNVSLLQQFEQLRQIASTGVVSKSAESHGGFGDLLQQAVNQVNDAQQKSSQIATAFESGERDVELVDVMIQMQKSRISFEALTQVRNRVLTAYQDIMNMQI